jgi:hypothetical protein
VVVLSISHTNVVVFLELTRFHYVARTLNRVSTTDEAYKFRLRGRAVHVRDADEWSGWVGFLSRRCMFDPGFMYTCSDEGLANCGWEPNTV